MQSSTNLRIEDNVFNSEARMIAGRSHELIIDKYNEYYCTNCTYYLGLYSEYDVV
jgi:hypothetical protein